jgi:hypothetical protein
VWPVKTCFYFIFFWLGCFYALVNPIWGVVNYMIAYQSNPTNTWWGLPLTAIGMRFSLLAAAFTLVGLVLGRKRVPSAGPTMTAWEWGVVALFGVAFVNMFAGFTWDHRSVMAMDKLWKMWLFLLVITRLGSERGNFKLVLWSLVMGSLYVGYDAYTAGPSDFLSGRLNRIGGPDFSTSSGTAAHLSAMLPIIGAVFLITRGWLLRSIAVAAGGLTVNGIVLCRTRSAFVGLLVGAVAAALMAPRARRFRIYILLIGGAGLAYGLTDPHYWNRMSTLAASDPLNTDLAAVSRKEIWNVSLDILQDHPLGIGAGNFARVISVYEPRYSKRSTHNTLLVCFVELGIQGGLIFLGLILISLLYLYETARMARWSARPLETSFLAYGLLVSCVTYVVTGLGTERFYCESFWWVLALPVCLYRLVRAEAYGTVTCREEAGTLRPALLERVVPA